MPRLAILTPDAPPVAALLDRNELVVGRGETSDLVLVDPSVSRRHARLFRGEANWLVEDLGSRHGTFLNGVRIDRAQVLEQGDRLGVGVAVLVFEPPPDAALDRITTSRPPTEPRLGPTLVGPSEAMGRVRHLIDRFAPSDVTVLVQGETGTGKEIVAHMVHARSPRRQGPFIVVNCPAIPDSLIEAELFGTERGVATGVDARQGLVESAGGGTLFLDEVGDLEPGAQAKLLRFLQDKQLHRVGSRKPREVDVRVVAATHHDLGRLVATGRFRRDLYHRLEVATIEVPPLRDRREDIPALIEHFLATASNGTTSVSREALAVLAEHDYPGNVRELEHAVRRAVLLAEGSVIRPEHLPRSFRACPLEPRADEAPREDPVADRLERIVGSGESFWSVVREPFLRRQLSREHAREILRRAHADAGGSLKETARHLGVADDYRKFVDFLRNHDLQPDEA